MRNALLEVVATYRGTVLDAQHLRPASRYTVGGGEAASFSAPPVDLLTPEGFELARMGERAWIRFAPGMQGEIVAGDRRYSLQQWQARGWTVAEDGAMGTTLPAGARARIEHGEVTFHLSLVEAPALTLRRAQLDAPFWAITAATFVVLVSLLVLAHLAMPGTAHLDLEDYARTNRFVAYVHRPDDAPKPPPSRPVQPVQPVQEATPLPAPAPAPARPSPVVAPTPAAAPAASDPAVVAEAPRSGSRGARRARASGPEPTIFGLRSVEQAGDLMSRTGGPIEAAGSAGVMAMVDVSGVVDNPYSNAFSPDTDDRQMWEAMNEQDFMAHSPGARLLVGTGRGGGEEALEELVTSKDEPDEDGARDDVRTLRVRAGTATVRGPRARDAVRSVVVRHVRDLRSCYDQGVDRDPSLSGEVTLKLEIDASGEVVGASTSRFSDPAVGDCMAAAATRWRFPEVDRRRRSHVSVPLTLRQR